MDSILLYGREKKSGAPDFGPPTDILLYFSSISSITPTTGVEKVADPQVNIKLKTGDEIVTKGTLTEFADRLPRKVTK